MMSALSSGFEKPQLGAGASPVDLAKDADEILEKVTRFEREHSQQLYDFTRNYKLYRAIPLKARSEQQSNTFYPELTIEVEALATAIHEMVFSDASDAQFFQMTAGHSDIDSQVRASVSQAALEKQMTEVQLERKVLPFFRKLVLQGTMPVHVPWRLDMKTYFQGGFGVQLPHFDCWDFEPVDVINFGFDDVSPDIERCEWGYTLAHVRPSGAHKMVRRGVWDSDVVESALAEGIVRNVHDVAQRHAGGYVETMSVRGLTAVNYVGYLESRNDDVLYWAVLDRKTGRFLKPPEPNPYQHGEKHWLVAKWIDLPEEFYGMGAGHLNYRTQSEVNDRRNFINDILYASLYNMWLKKSDSGIQLPGNKMRWRPHEIIEGDGIDDSFLRALRPDMGGLPSAISLEQADIERMRRASGATTTLQAVATGVTATESQSVQSEATRRIKAMVRSNVASFFRQLVYRAHKLNLQFLTSPVMGKFTDPQGAQIFGHIDRSDLLIDPDVNVKMTTDLDFRPFKRRELIDLLQTFGQLSQSGIAAARGIIPDPIIEELARTYNMDPRAFFSRQGLLEMETQRQMQDPAVQQQAVKQMVQESPAAQKLLNTGPTMAMGDGSLPPTYPRPYPQSGGISA